VQLDGLIGVDEHGDRRLVEQDATAVTGAVDGEHGLILLLAGIPYQ